jgi:adenine-specific DNA-methyltransferase
MLNHNGVLGYITPSSFFNSVAGARLRQKIVADNLLVKLLNLKHCQVFEATTYSTVAVLTPNAPKNATVEYYEYDANKEPTLIERLTQDDFYFNGNFYFATRSKLSELREILSLSSGDKFAVKNGFATLADQFFIGDEKFDFEEFTIPIVKASTGKWTRCFFPYDSDGRLVPFEELSKNPSIKTYCEKNYELLRRRSLTNPNDWHGFGRTQGLKDVAKNKYAINALLRGVNDIKLTQCPAGTGVYSGLYILTDLSFDELKGLLYSEDFIVYISSLKKYKSGGYYAFSSKDLKTYLEYQWRKRRQLNR